MTTLEIFIQAKLILIKLALVLIALSLPTTAMSFPGFPRKELPFCPGGGPSGWLNYFDYKRDQNIRRRYQNYQHPNLQSYDNKSRPHRSAYSRPYPYSPHSHSYGPWAIR